MTGLKYEDAGVNIEAGNKAVDRMKEHVKKTFTKDVLTGLGSFGSLYSLKSIINKYDDEQILFIVEKLLIHKGSWKGGDTWNLIKSYYYEIEFDK